MSNHRPKRSSAKVKEPSGRSESVESSLDADSDSDIEQASTRAKVSSPVQIETIIDSSSNASITPITPNGEIIESLISPSSIGSSPEIVDLNTKDAKPKDAKPKDAEPKEHPLAVSPDMDAQSSENFAPNVLKNNFLLLNSDDTDVSDPPSQMEETSQRTGNLFGFSTGTYILLKLHANLIYSYLFCKILCFLEVLILVLIRGKISFLLIYTYLIILLNLMPHFHMD